MKTLMAWWMIGGLGLIMCGLLPIILWLDRRGAPWAAQLLGVLGVVLWLVPLGAFMGWESLAELFLLILQGLIGGTLLGPGGAAGDL